MKTTAYYTKAPNASFENVNVEIPDTLDNEILVEIKATGICHTDESARKDIIPVPKPIVLGHEGSGIVKEIGKNVTGFEVGDHVALSFGYCGHCKPCIEGRPFACENMGFLNFAGVSWDGKRRFKLGNEELASFFSQSSFAEHVVVHTNNAVKIDKDFDLRMAGPLGCGIMTGAGTVLNGFRPPVGSSFATFGCGAVGMAALMGARLCGCETIIAVGGNPESLKLATELGATHTINRKECDDIPGRIREITGYGLDYAVETSGVPSMLYTALDSLNYLGKLAPAGGTMGLNDFMLGAKTIMGVTMGHANPQIFIPQLISYYKQGRFPVDKLMKFYPMDKINEAFEESNSGKAIKAILVRE